MNPHTVNIHVMIHAGRFFMWYLARGNVRVCKPWRRRQQDHQVVIPEKRGQTRHDDHDNSVGLSCGMPIWPPRVPKLLKSFNVLEGSGNHVPLEDGQQEVEDEDMRTLTKEIWDRHVEKHMYCPGPYFLFMAVQDYFESTWPALQHKLVFDDRDDKEEEEFGGEIMRPPLRFLSSPMHVRKKLETKPSKDIQYHEHMHTTFEPRNHLPLFWGSARKLNCCEKHYPISPGRRSFK
eukprot:scaffold26_cov158-Amphora_coffeaeformis.AAC.5